MFDVVVRGKLNKQTADAPDTSERTIKAHRRGIMHKLPMRCFAEPVPFAERLGILAEAR